MSTVEIVESAVNVEATLIARDLGLRPEHVLEEMRTGRLTATCEQGVGEDVGRVRLTFYRENRRLRLIVDSGGRVLEQTAARLHPRRRGGAARAPG